MNKMTRYILPLSKNVVRVAYTKGDVEPQTSELISEGFSPEPSDESRFMINDDEIEFIFEGKRVLKEINAQLFPKEVLGCYINGNPVIGTKLTANGEVSYIKNAHSRFERFSNSGSIEFEIGEKELLLGLGQYEDGIFNYRNHTEYLYESNMKIAIPFLITTGGYGILIDSMSNMIFKSSGTKITFEIDTLENLVYYVIFGKDVSQIIKNYQNLTGKASMLPRWVYGYIQSKERYQSGQELEEVVSEFRRRHIPIDCLVQDWYTWEDGLWGEKIFDKRRYPDFKKNVETLHNNNVRVMVSVWPNMSPQSSNYKEFSDCNGLLINSNVYNAFDETCRNLYWQQCENEIMSSGTDALWCDNSEPFSDADWNGKTKRSEELRYNLVVEDSKKSMIWEKLNAFGLYHAKGIFENWRKNFSDKRVVNLTRSGYAASQQYGTILWSGDICARWETISNQIVEGMKMGLSGNPYWTLDIGGFFTVKDKYENRGCNDSDHKPLWFWNGDFNDGVKDPGYRELYTRWIQFGVFLPMFRSHGTDTPREPWQFQNSDGIELPFYETILKFIRLRYKFLPYTYSLAYKAHTDAYILMRSFVFDFYTDEKALKCTDEYMYGDAFLVSPIYEPMYYGPNGKKINTNNYTKEVYLPGGAGWYDYWTNTYYEGGKTISVNAQIETMPLFVKGGSIIPVSGDIEYSDQKHGDIEALYVYEGAEGHFSWYNDDGDGYDYLEGKYSLVDIMFNDKNKIVQLSEKTGEREVDIDIEIHMIFKTGIEKKKQIHYEGCEVTINF